MWDELGIPPTSDPRVIRKAYATRLRIVHKSADAAAFQRLRAAYESALALAGDGKNDPVACEPAAPQQPAQTTGPIESPSPPDVLSQILGQIHAAVGARDISAALTLYDRALAQGTLPIGT